MRTSSPVTALNYRAEVDGLRAIAVVPVILYHAGAPGFSGGFVGVDIFFVISGYLITSILIKSISEKKFSILNFYERRARRILPALIFVVFFTLLCSAFILFPSDFKGFGKSLLATGIFGSNILFWQEAGYFDTANELKPLIHTWSLAVEEQFYVIFPILLFAISLFGLIRKRLVLILSIAFISGFLFADWASGRYQAASFFLLPTRAWELLGGSLVAAYFVSHAPPRGMLAEIGSTVGLLLIAIAIVVLDSGYYWPGRWALLPVVGTMLLIVCAQSRTRVAQLLSWSPLVSVGLLSYSAYLWHQPLFALARHATPTGQPSVLAFAALIAMTFTLSWISWRFVERPFRDAKQVSGRQVVGLVLVGTLGLAGLGAFASWNDGWPERFSAETLQLIATADEDGRGRRGCVAAADMPGNGCRFGEGVQDRRVLLWGDSHAMALSDVLAAELEDRGYQLETLMFSGCPPILGVNTSARSCAGDAEAVVQYIESGVAPEIVIVHAYFAVYTNGTKLAGSQTIDTVDAAFRILDAGDRIVSALEQSEFVTSQLLTTVQRLSRSGARILVVGGVPEPGVPVATYMARRSMFGLSYDLRARRSIHLVRNHDIAAALEVARAEGAIEVFDPMIPLCEASEDQCALHDGATPFYRDDNHLSLAGAERLTPHIADLIIPIHPAR